jgi:hypothetical protein
MDGSSFDDLARLWARQSRRGFMRGVLPSFAGAALVLAAIPGMASGKKREKRKRRCTKECGICGRCAKVKKHKRKGKGKGKGKRRVKHVCRLKPAGTSCVPGAECVPNGGCARICSDDVPCPMGCGCSHPTVDGPTHCVAFGFDCDAQPQACSSTAECPPGHHCQQTGCDGDPTLCVPLCPV